MPVAGLGTRFLPATKALPKEMLPIVDVPTVQLNVEECIASGIEEIIFVTARGKNAIEDHFDRAPELESLLERKGRKAELASLRKLTTMAKFVSVRQGEARGLGHAVLCARAAVGNEPFAVLLGDDLMCGDPPGLSQLLTVYDREGKGVVGLQEVPVGQEHMYGIVAGERIAEGDARDRSGLKPMYRLSKLIEKPAPGTAPSRLAIIGRYVLPPEIFDILERTPPGRGDEIQLTDGLATLCADRGLCGVEIAGRRFDAGDRAGYVLAVLYHALRRADIGSEVQNGAERLLAELRASK
ncbi:MAG TPA: UTP--glucose-1-phosphate uridylyltransferase [Polyangia bacterium]|jgi:UTP--glucose-1-phosphate uridylyltransferase|nr:UTP--glucose-1-phosphate uridylyltransferase [Polyangia bacterium]